jgi:hypothetical protein
MFVTTVQVQRSVALCLSVAFLETQSTANKVSKLFDVERKRYALSDTMCDAAGSSFRISIPVSMVSDSKVFAYGILVIVHGLSWTTVRKLRERGN